MPFDLNNYNIESGSKTAKVADWLNAIVDALENGVQLEDAGVAYASASQIYGELKGMSGPELKFLIAKAALANVFDELAER
jgi:hypothetical protein